MSNWRSKLLWRVDLIDIDYWLNYSNSKDKELDEWFEDEHIPWIRATNDWVKNSDFREEDIRFIKGNKKKIKEFIRKFLEQHGKINASIVQAFIMQEGEL